MENFTDKGLIILPPRANYLNMAIAARERFNKTLELLPCIFESNYGIKLFYFNTNVIFGIPMPDSMQSIFCLCRGDIDYLNGVVKNDGFFELVGDDKGQFITDEYDGLREKVKRLYPFERGISLEQRIKVIEARELRLSRYIAQKFSLIISFENDGWSDVSRPISSFNPNNCRYDLNTKKNDGRVLIKIEPSTMAARGYLSGENINMVSLMNKEWAYKIVSMWEVAV